MGRQPVQVVGAVIVRSGLVLCAQRGPGARAGLWEFPGGKVEPDETPSDALVREIREELDCTVAVGGQLATATHAYDDVTVELSTYRCTLVAGEPRPREHSALCWLAPDRLERLLWAPADLPTLRLLVPGHAAWSPTTDGPHA